MFLGRFFVNLGGYIVIMSSTIRLIMITRIVHTIPTQFVKISENKASVTACKSIVQVTLCVDQSFRIGRNMVQSGLTTDRIDRSIIYMKK